MYHDNMVERQTQVTTILREWSAGDASAVERLIPIVYDELRAVARRHLQKKDRGRTLQATSLVHEVYLRLMGAQVSWKDRQHFFAVAARTMRRVLVDQARERNAQKRGGGWLRATLDEGVAISETPALEMIAVDEAMAGLQQQDERAASAAELHWFAGLSQRETAKLLEVSPATVDRDLRFARAWLTRALSAA